MAAAIEAGVTRPDAAGLAALVQRVARHGQPVRAAIESMTGATPHHAHEEFIAIVADAPLARMLNISAKSPLLLRRHTVFDAGNRPFEYAEVRYVSSRFALSLDLKRG